jgi:His-Xaa-Ser system protein HxsD
MLEIRTSPGDGRVALALDEASYPRDAVYAAAFAFIDRCWVHLDRAPNGRLEVSLRPKAAGGDLEALGGELKDELLGQAWRQKVIEENRSLVEEITMRAFGAPAAAAATEEAGSLDDLLAAEGGAFEDPLGIAMSWEEKYAKKADGDAKPEGGAA